MSTQALTKPKIRWYVYAGPDENGRLVKIPRTATMRGHWPGYDAECSCGWESKTGGAIRAYIAREVWLHKITEHGMNHDGTYDDQLSQKEHTRG